MNLSDNLKRIRKENNLSQEQLADKLGVSRQSVSKWESGQAYPEMDKVLQLCQLFNLNIDELLNQNIKTLSNFSDEQYNYIQHFGVLGMRWGHRKNKSSPSNFSLRRQIKKQRKDLVKNRYLLSDTELNKQINRLQRENTLKNLARQD